MALVQFRRDKKAGKFRKITSTKALVKKAVRKATKSAFAKKVLAVVKRNEETKYRAVIGQQSYIIGQALSTPAGLQKMLAPVAQGVGDFQRIGEKIQPVKARVDFTFNWTNDNQNNQDVVVNLWIVTIKGYNNYSAYATAPTKQFVRVGDGTNRDLDDPDQPMMLQEWAHAPLNTDQYTLLKHYRFRMRKGTGNQANDAPAVGIIAPTGTTAGEDQRYISYSWTPPTLNYDDNAVNQPTSHWPLYGCYATNADGSAYGDTLQISSRLHLWFKDA